MKEARNETEAVMFGAIDEVLGKTGLKPVDIGIVVVNSSLFNPSPSLAATIVNHYKLRQSVVTYTLGVEWGADDRSYSCAFQQEDETNELGVSPLNDLMSVAGEALKATLKMKIVKPNVPNFKLAFEHFHIHAGGRSVLDELEKSLGLLPMHMEAWSLPGCLITGLGIPPAAHCGTK
ncbi:hypothetical protein V6N13_061722 [Hibiscus sabdariffa]